MEKVGIGIVGCGNISGAYLKAMRDFPILDVRGVADLNAELAQARAAEFAVPAQDLDALFADPTVEIVVNLTIPQAHVAVAMRALDAGKHTYSEKPLGVTFAEGRRLAEAAAAKGLRIGAAPDTFLGGGHQTAAGGAGRGADRPAGGRDGHLQNPGHERWHPNPAFYYKKGGGPVLDMAPYYVTALVNLLGPVAEVAGFAATPRPTPDDHQRAPQGRDDRGRGADPCRGHAALRGRRARADRDELRRRRPPPHPDRGLRHRRLNPRPRSQPLRRSGRGAAQGRRVGGAGGRGALCRRQLPLDRRHRHGACTAHGPAAPRVGRAGTARARGDGIPPHRGGRAPQRRDHHRGRPAGAAGGLARQTAVWPARRNCPCARR